MTEQVDRLVMTRREYEEAYLVRPLSTKELALQWWDMLSLDAKIKLITRIYNLDKEPNETKHTRPYTVCDCANRYLDTG